MLWSFGTQEKFTFPAYIKQLDKLLNQLFICSANPQSAFPLKDLQLKVIHSKVPALRLSNIYRIIFPALALRPAQNYSAAGLVGINSWLNVIS